MRAVLTTTFFFLTAGSLLRAVPALAQAPAMCEQTQWELQAPAAPTDGRLIITADQGLLAQDGISNLSGAVRLLQGDKEFSASALSYDDEQRLVSIKVESLFRSRDLTVKSREARFDLSAGNGTFEDTKFTLMSRAARGSSDLLTVDRNGQLQIEGASYTTCTEGKGWQLESDHIKLDRESGLGTARQTTLRFGRVPVLWMPWFQFPIDDRRRTGLLFPTVGETRSTGFDVRVPVYLNLGPNYDATLTPRLMSRRGLQIGSHARYLVEDGEGSIRVDYLPEDKLTGEDRGYLQSNLVGLISDRLGFRMNVGAASDRTYFEDLGDQGELSSITHLERAARLTYQAPAAYTITAMAQSYQTISSNLLPIDQPYARLPQLRLRALTKNSRYATRAGFNGEYVSFVRTRSVEGQRLDLNPYLRTEREAAAWHAAVQADYRYTAYDLSSVAAGQPTRPTRSLPQFSAEGGLRFERITSGGRLQTLEPYLFYLYTPFRSQDSLPLFDTGQPDFDYTQLFARNRFSGEDRIADANQFTVAARSRLLDPDSGEVKLALSVGQLFRLADSRVRAPGISAPDSGPTDFFADLNYRLAQRWNLQTAAAWSPNEKQFNRFGLALRYRDAGRRADLAYRYRRDILEQADFAASLPISDSWRGALRTRYSLRDNASLDNLVGLEYETCCYAIRSSYRRFIATAAGEYNNGIYLQLELKGLTRIGAGFDGLLPVDETLESSENR